MAAVSLPDTNYISFSCLHSVYRVSSYSLVFPSDLMVVSIFQGKEKKGNVATCLTLDTFFAC